MDMCKIFLILNLFFRSIYFNVLKYLLFLISLVNIHLYILIYIYANVLNYILFQSILTNVLCMFYVSKKKKNPLCILYMHVLLYLFCTHYPILYVLLLSFKMFRMLVMVLCLIVLLSFCRKIAQMS